MNYPYNQHIIFFILCKLHVRHVSQVSDLRSLGSVVDIKGFVIQH